MNVNNGLKIRFWHVKNSAPTVTKSLRLLWDWEAGGGAKTCASGKVVVCDLTDYTTKLSELYTFYKLIRINQC